MYFIFGLTPSTHGYNAISMCVDKLSKMIHFIPTKVKETCWKEFCCEYV